MDNSSENRLRVWALVIGVLLILSLMAIGVVLAIQQGTQQAVRPVSDLTSNLGTQVAAVLHPTPTILPDPVTVIQEVHSLARLETIQYSVEKVITAEMDQGVFNFLFGDKLLFVAHGVVIAGVDMAKLGPHDLFLQNGVLYVWLPEPEIFIATLDNNKSYVYSRDQGLLTKGDINLETSARQAAEQEIARAAIDDGILEQARQNAENYLQRFFLSLGFHNVIFVHPSVTPTPEFLP